MRIIAFRDDGWFNATTDMRLWDHLCRAFGVEFQLIREWKEAAITGDVYLLDEHGNSPLHDHVVDRAATYVIGRTHLNLLDLSIPHRMSIKISTPRRR